MVQSGNQQQERKEEEQQQQQLPTAADIKTSERARANANANRKYNCLIQIRLACSSSWLARPLAQPLGVRFPFAWRFATTATK